MKPMIALLFLFAHHASAQTYEEVDEHPDLWVQEQIATKNTVELPLAVRNYRLPFFVIDSWKENTPGYAVPAPSLIE